jgi:membrane-associated phospholipid phosphatase
LSTFDEGWYRNVADFAQHTRWLNGIMGALTILLIAILALMVCYAGWRAWRRSEHVHAVAAAWTVIGCGLGVGCGLALKHVFHESRPCLTMPNVPSVQACPGPTDYSFPSDHAIVAAALAAGLWLINRQLGVIGAALALLEGYSRVYLGQHYPHDVLAAYLLSGLIVFGGWRLVRGPLLRLESRIPPRPHGPRDADEIADTGVAQSDIERAKAADAVNPADDGADTGATRILT